MPDRDGIIDVVIPILRSPRLVLRPFAATDLDDLTELFAEESFWWYPLRRAMTPEETQRFLERTLVAYDEPDPALHAVVEVASGSLAGWAGLAVPRFLPEILPAVEVGWRLGERFRGRGYATEAGGTALQWGFEDLELKSIVSIAEPANVASLRVMDHLGFSSGVAKVDPTSGQDLLVRTLDVETWRSSDVVATRDH